MNLSFTGLFSTIPLISAKISSVLVDYISMGMVNLVQKVCFALFSQKEKVVVP